MYAAELEDFFLRVGGRFSRVEPRQRMRDYVRGLLGPAGRKNGWQLAEFAGHATPDGLQRLLADSFCVKTDEGLSAVAVTAVPDRFERVGGRRARHA